MGELEKFLEKLENLNDSTKKKIMWVGVPVVMFAVIMAWWSFASFNPEQQSKKTASGPSKFDVFMNGVKVSFGEMANIFNNTKNAVMDKFTQTNSFNVEAPAEKSAVSTTTVEATTTATATTTNQ